MDEMARQRLQIQDDFGGVLIKNWAGLFGREKPIGHFSEIGEIKFKSYFISVI
jgi:hypothetical protein